MSGRWEAEDRSCNLFKVPQIIPLTPKALVHYIRSSALKSLSEVLILWLFCFVQSGSHMDMQLNPDVSNEETLLTRLFLEMWVKLRESKAVVKHPEVRGSRSPAAEETGEEIVSVELKTRVIPGNCNL